MGMLATVTRKVRSVAALSALEIALILPVVLMLGLARLAILTLPFQRYARAFGQPIGLSASTFSLCPLKASRARRIGRVLRACARITPWASLCLAQAMVAGLLLRLLKIPHHVYFGLKPNTDSATPDPLAAHAWIRTDGTNVTGGQNVSMFTVVNVFEHRTKEMH